MAVLPEDEYRRLLDVVEDREDRDAASQAEERRKAGEEYIPASVVDKLMAGESPLKVWRRYRGLTQAELASRNDISKMTVSGMANGTSSGSIDRTSVVQGKSVSDRVDLGGGRFIKKKKNMYSIDKRAKLQLKRSQQKP